MLISWTADVNVSSLAAQLHSWTGIFSSVIQEDDASQHIEGLLEGPPQADRCIIVLRVLGRSLIIPLSCREAVISRDSFMPVGHLLSFDRDSCFN